MTRINPGIVDRKGRGSEKPWIVVRGSGFEKANAANPFKKTFDYSSKDSHCLH